MNPEFSVRKLIRNEMNTSQNVDVAEVARKVAPQVPEAYLQEVLERALQGLVRDVLAENRPRGPIGNVPQPTFRPPAPAAPQTGAVSTLAPAVSGPHPVASARPARVTSVGGRKGAEIRDAWQKVLEAHYATETGRKQLGDLTYEDCQWIAAEMDRQADALSERARGFRRLGSLLLHHEADTIRDLPAEIKMQALGARS